MQNLTLHSIIAPSVFTVSPDAPLADVLASMESLRVSCIVAVDEARVPLGIFTEQDAIRLMAERKPVKPPSMADVMSSPPLTAPLNMDFCDGYRLISEKGFRHLVVVDDAGQLAGVVSEADFMHHMGMEYLVELKTVGSTMTRNVATLPESATLADAVELMARNKISCVVVANDGKPVGILTERDTVALARTVVDPTQVHITRVMTSPVQTIDAGLPVQQAMQQMKRAAIRRLVVVEGEILAGIITRHDIVKIMQGRYIEFLHETLERQHKELVKAKAQIEQSRQQLFYHSLMEQISDAVYLLDAESGKILNVNDQACRNLGYTRDELLNLSVFDISMTARHPDAWRNIVAAMRRKPQIIESQHRRYDGSLFPVEINARLIEEDGKPYLVAVARDLTDIRQAEKAIQEAHGSLNALVEAIPDAIFFKDGEGHWLIANEPAKRLFKLHEIDWQGKTEMELAKLRPDFRPVHEACRVDDETTWQAGQLMLFAETVHDENGMPRHFEVRKVPLFDAENRRKGLVTIGRDITERLQAEEQLLEAAAVMQSTHEGVVITDTTPAILAINAAYSAITGYSQEEVIGKNPSVISSGRADRTFHETMWKSLLKDGYWQGEIWNRRKSGEIYPQLLTISTVYDEKNEPIRYVGVFADITQLKENQAQLEFMAHHDPLTQLPNRALVESRLEQEVEQAHRHGHQAGVLFIDLDRFKQVNDSFGHLVGDELLCAVAQRLGARLREGDTLGRLGGDEFILLISPLRDPQDAAVVARDFIAALNEPFRLSDGGEVFIGGSIGISLFPQDGETVSELMKNADAAMYLAKENGRNQFSFYTRALNADARAKLAMENELRRTLLKHELALHYQPKVDLRSGQICGAEALSRWRLADGSMVSPAEFIPLAEKSSLILNLGAWVIEQACMQVRAWLDEGLPDICVAINISARQFRSGNLDKQLEHALESYGLEGRHLELELTESMLMHEPEQAVAAMHKLKQLGVKISLDDFGTGYSSLAYLSRFPIDTLKIDQSFVRGVITDPDSAEIASAIIGLAHRMKLRVVAEGVETEDQLSYMRTNGCDELQGYYFSKPLPADDFAELLRSGKSLAA
jgi:diguanylate cyclase (GGDEF)-like protein/PAS domain S-box-containing protein